MFFRCNTISYYSDLPMHLGVQAYRECARIHHPDKGGNAERFSRVQAAFETLSDPRKRAVYDEWAKELQFRYVPGVTRKVQSFLVLGRYNNAWRQ